MMTMTSKVFIVDDDEAVLTALKRLLTCAGLSIETFSSASTFLAQVLHDQPSCAVLDLRMPELTGLEIQRRVHDTDEALAIVFLTGYGDVPTSVQAMKAGLMEVADIFVVNKADRDGAHALMAELRFHLAPPLWVRFIHRHFE